MFGLKHLEAMLFSIIVIALIVRYLVKKDYEVKKVMIVFVSFFYIFELLKVAYFVFVEHRYPVSAYPFYLCSTPLYFMWILIFSKNEKILQMTKAAVFAIFLTAGVAALLYPSIIIGGNSSWTFSVDNIRPAISILFHTLMVTVPIYMIWTKYYVPKYKDVIYVEIVILIMIIIVSILNTTLDADFFFLNRGEGSPIRFLHDQHLFLFKTLTVFLHLIIIGGISVLSTFVYHKTKNH